MGFTLEVVVPVLVPDGNSTTIARTDGRTISEPARVIVPAIIALPDKSRAHDATAVAEEGVFAVPPWAR